MQTRRNQGKKLLFIADGEVLTAAVIQEVITNGQVQIAGDFTMKQAEDVVNLIKACLEPVRFYVETRWQ